MGHMPGAIDFDWKSAECQRLQKSDLLAPCNSCAFNAADLFEGFYDGAISRPGKALMQIAGISSKSEQAAAAPVKQSDSHKTGEVVGSLIPYVTLVGLTRGASAEILGSNYAPTMAVLVTEQASAGFIYGSLLTPSELKPGQDLFSARLNQGREAATTHATMTGTSESLEREMPKLGADSNALAAIARKVSLSLISGTVRGYVDANGVTNFGKSSEDSLSALMTKTAVNKFASSTDKLLDLLISSDSKAASDKTLRDLSLTDKNSN